VEQEWEERYIHENYSKILRDGLIEMVSIPTKHTIIAVFSEDFNIKYCIRLLFCP